MCADKECFRIPERQGEAYILTPQIVDFVEDRDDFLFISTESMEYRKGGFCMGLDLWAVNIQHMDQKVRDDRLL